MSASESLLVGLDCGGSTCRVLAMNAQDQVVFRGQSGPANLASTPAEVLQANLVKATNGCPSPSHVCGCFAGMLTSSDRERGKTLLAQVFPNSTIRVEGDYAAAFAAFAEPIDVCVIAGTGSLICSRSGKSWERSGGGGYLLGDEGSATDLGRRALRAGLERATAGESWWKAITEQFECETREEVVAALYAAPNPASKLATLAPILAQEAQSGHPVALKELKAALLSLACQTSDHVGRFLSGTGTVRIGLAGGVWKISPTLSTMFRGLLDEQIQRELDVTRLERPPVYGAIALAKEQMLGN